MRHVLVHLTPDLAHPARYAAGTGVTVRIAPGVLDSPQAKTALGQAGATLLAVEQAADSGGLHAMLHGLRPHASRMWDGGWGPDVAQPAPWPESRRCSPEPAGSTGGAA